MKRYQDCPQILKDFLIYHESIKGQSQLTINEYYLDLRMFFRFIKLMRYDMPIDTRLDDIDIKDVDLSFVETISTSDRDGPAPRLPPREDLRSPQPLSGIRGVNNFYSSPSITSI